MRPQLNRRRLLPIVEIDSVLPPPIFRAVFSLCQTAISCGNNHRDVRERITSLRFALMELAVGQHGAPTPEVTLLYDLLKRTDERRKNPKVVANLIDELVNRGDFTPEHMEAAKHIIDVWRAFSRFLSVAARNYNGGDSHRSVVLEPVDVMSDDLVALWRDQFQPWHRKAARRRVPTARPQFISGAFTVIQALSSQEPTPTLDSYFGLSTGETVRVLREEFTAFNDPAYVPTYGGAIRERLDRVFDATRRENDSPVVAGRSGS